MAPLTYKARESYLIAETVEVLIVLAIVFIGIGFLGCLYLLCLKCYKKCSQSADDSKSTDDSQSADDSHSTGYSQLQSADDSQSADVSSCKYVCCQRSRPSQGEDDSKEVLRYVKSRIEDMKIDDKDSKTADTIAEGCGKLLSSVFPLIETAKSGGKQILLFSKRKPDKWHGCVMFYYLILLFVLLALFLFLFCNFLLYRKTSTCNDINVETNFSICFNIHGGYKAVDCVKEKDQKLEVICYLLDFNFFRALGIAFGAIQAITTLVSIIVPLSIAMGQKAPALILAIQIIASLALIAVLPVFYTLHWKHIFDPFLYGDPVLVHAIFVLANIVGFLIVWHPWCLFKNSSDFEQEITSQPPQAAEMEQVADNSN